MTNQTCSACGCTIAEAALRSNQVVRRGTRVYCMECAKLIMAPDELLFSAGRAPQQPQPPTPPASGGSPSPRPKVISAVRFSRGGEVVDRVRISPQGRTPAAPPAAPQPPQAPPPRELTKGDDRSEDATPDDEFGDMEEIAPKPPTPPPPVPSPPLRAQIPAQPRRVAVARPPAATSSRILLPIHPPAAPPPRPPVPVQAPAMAAPPPRSPAPVQPAVPPAAPQLARPPAQPATLAKSAASRRMLPSGRRVARAQTAGPLPVGTSPQDEPLLPPNGPAVVFAPSAAPHVRVEGAPDANAEAAEPVAAQSESAAGMGDAAAELTDSSDDLVEIVPEPEEGPAEAVAPAAGVEEELIEEVEPLDEGEEPPDAQPASTKNDVEAVEEAEDFVELEEEPVAAPDAAATVADRAGSDQEGSAVHIRRRPSQRTGKSARLGARTDSSRRAPEAPAEGEAEGGASEEGGERAASSSGRSTLGTRSSRRMAASASRSSRGSATEERDDKRGKRAAGAGGMSMGMMIGIGVGVLVLLVGGIALSGGGKKDDAKKPADALKDEDEKTASSVLEQLAERALANNERSAAVNFYTRAANKAEKEGNSNQARRYNMKAMDLIKTSKREDR